MRKHIVRSIIVAILLTLTSLLSSQVHAADAPIWPTEATMISYNPAHNATWGTASDSDIKWVFDSSGETLFTEVNVVDGIAYVGSEMNSIFALDVNSGKMLWHFKADNWIMTNPVVKDGMLFAGSGNRYVVPPPRPHTIGIPPNSVYGLNAKTGEVIWQQPVTGTAMPTPVYKDGRVYYVNGDRTLRVFDAKTGTPLYTRLIDSNMAMSSPTLYGNLLIWGGSKPEAVYAFDITTGKFVWQSVLADVADTGLADCAVAVYNDTVYLNGMRWVKYDAQNQLIINQYMYALDVKTGKLKWTYNEGTGPMILNNRSGLPVVADGVVYQTSASAQTLSAVDATTGKGVWQVKMPAPSKGGPQVFGQYLITGTSNGKLLAYDRATGKLITNVQLTGKMDPQGVRIYNGTIFAPTQDGFLYALPLGSVLKLDAPKAAIAKDGYTFYPQTGHSLGGIFRDYWQTHGGLAQFGYPTTDEIQQFDKASGKTVTVQYFERNRFEYHPEAPAEFQVLLGLLGNDLTATRRTAHETPFIPVADPQQASTHWYAQTGHTLSGDFFDYWNTHGGLAIYGYPISQEFQEVNPTDGKTYTVQYFERARFEKHPDAPAQYRVLLGLLGNQQLADHWSIPKETAHPMPEG